LRVAALYDVHGNVPALDAVLAEVDADVVVVGGDFLAGPWPQETFERLRALGGDVRFIRGNADREIVEEKQGLAPPEVMEFVRARLSPDAFAFLRELPLTVSVGELLFCHATPRNDEEILTRISPDERWRAALDGVDAAVVVCGHTHIQFDRRIDDIRVVNAGSIGMPYEHQPGAYWALLDDGDVQLQRTVYEPGDLSAWPGDWPEASPEEATEFFEKLSREHS
jgi:putative phosphoesterase